MKNYEFQKKYIFFSKNQETYDSLFTFIFVHFDAICDPGFRGIEGGQAPPPIYPSYLRLNTS